MAGAGHVSPDTTKPETREQDSHERAVRLSDLPRGGMHWLPIMHCLNSTFIFDKCTFVHPYDKKARLLYVRVLVESEQCFVYFLM